MTKWRTKSGGGREAEERGMRAEERGGRPALWLLLCRNVNTLQRSQKTMTPQGEEGARACVFLLSAKSACVPACVRAGAPTAPRGAEGERRR